MYEESLDKNYDLLGWDLNPETPTYEGIDLIIATFGDDGELRTLCNEASQILISEGSSSNAGCDCVL
jgi:hypothetical protein